MKMRIAVAGKGGSGKTTTAATLARLFARRGYRVAAIDDDPNPNLSTAIGLTPEQRAALSRVPREEILEEVKDDQGTATLHLKRPFVEVLRQYGASGPDGVDVLVMTGLLGTVRGLIGELGNVEENDVTVLDMEASIEHLSSMRMSSMQISPERQSWIVIRIQPMSNRLSSCKKSCWSSLARGLMKQDLLDDTLI